MAAAFTGWGRRPPFFRPHEDGSFGGNVAGFGKVGEPPVPTSSQSVTGHCFSPPRQARARFYFFRGRMMAVPPGRPVPVGRVARTSPAGCGTVPSKLLFGVAFIAVYTAIAAFGIVFWLGVLHLMGLV